jgi:hypothetical protein
MTTVLRVTALILLGILAGLWLGQKVLGPGPGGMARGQTGPTIEQVQRLATLVTMKVELADVQLTSARGYTGGMRVAMLIKGDALLGTDLNRARLEDVDPQARSAVLILPQPRVTSPRLDQERTRLFMVDTYGLWLLVPGDRRAGIMNQVYAQAQEAVARAAADPQLAEKARQQAEQVLGSFFAQQGWTLTIRWIE